jgi:hypothetical protein
VNSCGLRGQEASQTRGRIRYFDRLAIVGHGAAKFQARFMLPFLVHCFPSNDAATEWTELSDIASKHRVECGVQPLVASEQFVILLFFAAVLE